MGPKKTDPLADKARALNQEIAALQAEIKKLDSQVVKKLDSQAAQAPSPRYRSTAMPQGATIFRTGDKSKQTGPSTGGDETLFEDIKRNPLAEATEAEVPEIYNELGLRRYDLPALWKRLRTHFQPPATANTRLVNYLAAGGVHGLRPLRIEKRVARNRFFLLSAILLAIMLGIIWIYFRHR